MEMLLERKELDIAIVVVDRLKDAGYCKDDRR